MRQDQHRCQRTGLTGEIEHYPRPFPERQYNLWLRALNLTAQPLSGHVTQRRAAFSFNIPPPANRLNSLAFSANQYFAFSPSLFIQFSFKVGRENTVIKLSWNNNELSLSSTSYPRGLTQSSHPTDVDLFAIVEPGTACLRVLHSSDVFRLDITLLSSRCIWNGLKAIISTCKVMSVCMFLTVYQPRAWPLRAIYYMYMLFAFVSNQKCAPRRLLFVHFLNKADTWLTLGKSPLGHMQEGLTFPSSYWEIVRSKRCRRPFISHKYGLLHSECIFEKQKSSSHRSFTSSGRHKRLKSINFYCVARNIILFFLQAVLRRPVFLSSLQNSSSVFFDVKLLW